MKKIISILLCLLMILSLSVQTFAVDDIELNALVNEVGNYLYETVKEPKVGSIGGEWAVLGLARSEMDIPNEYYEKYYQAVEDYVRECSGILHDKKYTEYSRVVTALTAIGKNPEDVSGYNLLMPLGDYEKTIWQGINGSVWALIALDSGNYEVPQNENAKVQATRDKYINHILENQTSDGGWALSGDVADVDVTAMALQALAKYYKKSNVRAAVDKALLCMSQRQNQNGGFASWETENSESCAQMIVALCELGISFDDPRFVKMGNTMLDNLLTYYDSKKGFKHTYDSTVSNQMSTEQCFYAIVAVERMNSGKNSLYRMNDAITVADTNVSTGLPNKNADVRKMAVVNYNKTFSDIQDNVNKTEIEILASRNIISGKTEDSFEPECTMTRAEFATIITKALGLPIKESAVFVDVTKNDWFYNYVNTAYEYKIIKGISETEFNPNGTINREEAAVMVARSAQLCGWDTNIETFHARNILAEFFDYVKVSDWAISSLAFCYDEGILPSDVMEIEPKESVTRAEVAHMIYKLLEISKLL